MSARKAHPDRGVIVTSRKRGRVERRIANEIGIQRAEAARQMQNRLDERLAESHQAQDQRFLSGLVADLSGSAIEPELITDSSGSVANRVGIDPGVVTGWTDESVRALVAEVTRKGSAPRPHGVE